MFGLELVNKSSNHFVYFGHNPQKGTSTTPSRDVCWQSKKTTNEICFGNEIVSLLAKRA